MKIYTTVITGKKEVAKNTLEVSFKRPEGFGFDAGQYLQLEVPSLLYADDASNSRVFSIASSPNDRQTLSVAFRQSASGFKRSIGDLPVGSTVRLQGPYGFISLTENTRQPVICVAGGIGITPIMSMVRFAQENRLDIPLTILFANKSKETAPYLKELERRAKQRTRLELQKVFGLITEKDIAEPAAKRPDSAWVIAGPPGMVEHVQSLLLKTGISEHKIYYEEFIGY